MRPVDLGGELIRWSGGGMPRDWIEVEIGHVVNPEHRPYIAVLRLNHIPSLLAILHVFQHLAVLTDKVDHLDAGSVGLDEERVANQLATGQVEQLPVHLLHLALKRFVVVGMELHGISAATIQGVKNAISFRVAGVDHGEVFRHLVGIQYIVCVVIADAIHAVPCGESSIPMFKSRSVRIADFKQTIATEVAHLIDFIALGK